jgi:hypothetical protein
MIETLISSKTRIKLLIKFFINENNTAYLRSLEEEFKESTNGIRVELNRFEKAGFLESFNEGNKKVFKANTAHPLFSDLNRMILKTVGVEHVMDYILQRIGGLQEVYLVGELANGQSANCIELVLVGERLNKKFLSEQAEKAERKISKKIHCKIFTPDEFKHDVIWYKGCQPLLLWSR